MHATPPKYRHETDVALLERARAGDRTAYAQLWERHSANGLKYARSITSRFDPDDLVAEAFINIYRRIVNGGGPQDTFVLYLLATIKNTSTQWVRDGRDRGNVPLSDEWIPDPNTTDEAEWRKLDKGLAADAFKRLPKAWKEVLYLNEIEGLKPAQIGERLGIGANAAAARCLRAREGLREAWIQVHLPTTGPTPECEWTLDHLAGFVRSSLAARYNKRVRQHLSTCVSCATVYRDADRLGKQLSLALLLLLGGGLSVTSAAAAPGLDQQTAQGQGRPSQGGPSRWLNGTSITAGVSVAAASAAIVIGSLTLPGGTPADGATPDAQAPNTSITEPVTQPDDEPEQQPVIDPGDGEMVFNPGELPNKSDETDETDKNYGSGGGDPVTELPASEEPSTELPVEPAAVTVDLEDGAVLSTHGDVELTGRGEPGAIITITPDDESFRERTAIVGDDGAWSIVVPGFAEGECTLVIAQSVDGQQTGSITRHLSVRYRTPDVLVEPPVVHATRVSLGFPDFTGTSIDGAIITMLIDGVPYLTTTVLNNGEWAIDPSPRYDMLPGVYAVTFTQTVYGQTSAPSESFIVLLPKIDILVPEPPIE